LIFGLGLMWATSVTWLGPAGPSGVTLTPRAWTTLLAGLAGGFGSALLGFYLLQAPFAAGRLRIGTRRAHAARPGRYTEGKPSNDWADEQIT
jgi:hypothetical protein